MFPQEFIKGLLQSDGSRYIQTVNEVQRVKYNFTNTSQDIITLFCWACDLLKLHYTQHSRATMQYKDQTIPTGTIRTTITFNKKADVDVLDSFVGPKQ